MTQDAQAERALMALRTATKDVPGLRVDSCRKLSSFSAVFVGRLGPEKVIVKQFFEGGADQVLRMKAELDQVTERMNGTQHGINPCLLALPEIGVIILGHAGDLRLSDTLKAAGRDRPKWIAQSGDWLATYVGPRRKTETFRPRRWLDRLDAVLQSDAEIASLPNVRRGRQNLGRLGRSLMGAPFTRAATHGDFVSINAHVLDGKIIGVDVQGEAWLPLARDVARFLVWQQMTDPAPGPKRHGISTADLEPFLSTVDLPGDEALTILPFFIGLQLMQRLVDMRSDPFAITNGLAALGDGFCG